MRGDSRIPAATVKTRVGLLQNVLHDCVLPRGWAYAKEIVVKPHLVILAVVMNFVAQGAAAQGVSSGTAFLVAPELLITNQHVVEGCSSAEVISLNGRRAGFIAAADADIDLAILQVSGLGGTTARLRSPNMITLGEPVLVFGYPYSGELSSGGNFTSGLVSALRGFRDSANQIQITAPIQRGNSGGPLMDSSGLVIGVIQSKLSLKAARILGDIPQNVNFAISLEALTQFLAKHKVAFQTMARSPAPDTASVAAMAQKFTYRIECSVREQRANNSAAPKINRPSNTTFICLALTHEGCTSHVLRHQDGSLIFRNYKGELWALGIPNLRGQLEWFSPPNNIFLGYLRESRTNVFDFFHRDGTFFLRVPPEYCPGGDCRR